MSWMNSRVACLEGFRNLDKGQSLDSLFDECPALNISIAIRFVGLSRNPVLFRDVVHAC